MWKASNKTTKSLQSTKKGIRKGACLELLMFACMTVCNNSSIHTLPCNITLCICVCVLYLLFEPAVVDSVYYFKYFVVKKKLKKTTTTTTTDSKEKQVRSFNVLIALIRFLSSVFQVQLSC